MVAIMPVIKRARQQPRLEKRPSQRRMHNHRGASWSAGTLSVVSGSVAFHERVLTIARSRPRDSYDFKPALPHIRREQKR